MRSWENSKGTFWRVSPCFPYDPKRFTNILSGQSIFLKNHHLWNPKQPFIHGCFNWMSPNLYIENGCFTKHPFRNGCLGLQAIVSSFATNKVHLDLWLFDAWKSSKNSLPNGWFSGDLPWYHLKQIQDRKIAQQKQAQHQFKDILPPTFLTTSPNPRIKCANHMEAIKEDVSATPCSFAQGDVSMFFSLKWSSTFLSFSVSLRN